MTEPAGGTKQDITLADVLATEENNQFDVTYVDDIFGDEKKLILSKTHVVGLDFFYNNSWSACNTDNYVGFKDVYLVWNGTEIWYFHEASLDFDDGILRFIGEGGETHYTLSATPVAACKKEEAESE